MLRDMALSDEEEKAVAAATAAAAPDSPAVDVNAVLKSLVPPGGSVLVLTRKETEMLRTVLINKTHGKLTWSILAKLDKQPI